MCEVVGIDLLVYKVVNDCLAVCRTRNIEKSLHHLGKNFELVAMNRSGIHSFLGGKTTRSPDGSVHFYMTGYINQATSAHVPQMPAH